jgi:hypothetical protein
VRCCTNAGKTVALRLPRVLLLATETFLSGASAWLSRRAPLLTPPARCSPPATRNTPCVLHRPPPELPSHFVCFLRWSTRHLAFDPSSILYLQHKLGSYLDALLPVVRQKNSLLRGEKRPLAPPRGGIWWPPGLQGRGVYAVVLQARVSSPTNG